MPADVFISYSSNDQDRVVKIAEKLRSAGVSIWLDESGIGAATLWSKEIAGAIKGCKVLVLMVTPNSVQSKNVVKEVSLAAEQNKQILPVILEPTQIPEALEYHLAGIQHLDVNGMSASESAEEILPALQRLLGMESEESNAAGHSGRSSRKRSFNIWIDRRLYGVSLFVAFVTAGLGWLSRPDPELLQPKHWQIQSANLGSVSPLFELSPNAEKFIYAEQGGSAGYRVRDLTSGSDELLVGSKQGRWGAFFSKDGSHIGFLKNRTFMKLAVSGGEPTPIVNLTKTGSMFLGADWSQENVLVFAFDKYPLRMVSPGSNVPQAITELDGGYIHGWPRFLPDGKHVLYINSHRETNSVIGQVEVVNINTEVVTPLGIRSSYARYSPSGHLLFSNGSDIRAARFDVIDLSTNGMSKVVLQGVYENEFRGSLSSFDLADDGTLVYLKARDKRSGYRFYWLDAGGRISNATEEFEITTWWSSFDLSPDGKRIAFADAGGVMILELDTKSGWPLQIPKELIASNVRWAPNGESIYFHSNESGVGSLWKIRVTREEIEAESLLKSKTGRYILGNISADETSLIVAEELEPRYFKKLQVSLPSEGTEEELLPAGYRSPKALISPSGNALVYQTSAAGGRKVVVKPLLDSGDILPLFPGNRVDVFAWSKNENELYFQSGRQIFSTKIEVNNKGLNLTPRIEVLTFPERLDVMGWTPTNEKNRLLVLGQLDQGSSTNAPPLKRNAFSVISNFHTILNEKVPVGKE